MKAPDVHHLPGSRRPGGRRGERWFHLIPHGSSVRFPIPEPWTPRGQHHVQGHTVVSFGDRGLPHSPLCHVSPATGVVGSKH